MLRRLLARVFVRRARALRVLEREEVKVVPLERWDRLWMKSWRRCYFEAMLRRETALGGPTSKKEVRS